MLGFKDYNDLSDPMEEQELFIEEEIDTLLNEKIGSGWAKALSLTMLVKIRSYASQIKAEKDLENKINLLANLVMASAYLSNLSIATAAQDQSIAKKIRK